MLRQRWAILAIPVLFLFLTAEVAAAAPTLTIEPSRGPAGTNFVANLAGFTPGESIGLRLTAETTPPRTLDVPAVTIRADGGYRLDISALLLPAGGYTLAALRQGAVVASAGFTVTGPPPPSPRPSTPTGGGPVPTATRAPAAPVATYPPAAPSTGSGGNLPGMPNTGGGPPPSFPARAAFVGMLVLLALCLSGGRLLHRVARRRGAGK